MKGIHLVQHDLAGVRFAVNVFIGSAILWYVLRYVADSNPIWAIASMIAASEPVVNEAARLFEPASSTCSSAAPSASSSSRSAARGSGSCPSRSPSRCSMSSYLIRVKTMWRQAPITAAIVIASALTHQSKMTGLEHGLHKVAEVLAGCIMGLAVSWLMSKIWPLPHKPEPA